MTGYGKATATYGSKKICAEIKSLNSKALDLSTRIAPLYREKEMEIRTLIAQSLERGKVDFNLWIEEDSAQQGAPVNKAIVESYYAQIKAVSEATGIPEPADWFATLLRMPDVLTRTEVKELGDEEWATALTAVKEALEKLMDFRRQEGAALEKKFGEKLDNIESLLHSILERDAIVRGKSITLAICPFIHIKCENVFTSNIPGL